MISPCNLMDSLIYPIQCPKKHKFTQYKYHQCIREPKPNTTGRTCSGARLTCNRGWEQADAPANTHSRTSPCVVGRSEPFISQVGTRSSSHNIAEMLSRYLAHRSNLCRAHTHTRDIKSSVQATVKPQATAFYQMLFQPWIMHYK